MKLRVVCIAILFLVGHLPDSHAEEENRAIKPGQSIGKIRLGMSENDMINLLGQPASKDAIKGTAWDAWHSKSENGPVEETSVMLRRHDNRQPSPWEVRQATVTSSFFHTAGDVSTKSSLVSIWQEFPNLRYLVTDDGGDGTRLELYDDAARGIGFLIQHHPDASPDAAWGICRAVIVHDAGQGAMFDRIGKFLR